MWDLQRVSHGPSFSEHLRTADMVLILETVAFLFDNMIQACGTAGEAADANIPHGISLCSGCPTNDLGKTVEDGQGLWCPPTCLGDLTEAPGLGLPQPLSLQPSGQWTSGWKLPFCNSAFQIFKNSVIHHDYKNCSC